MSAHLSPAQVRAKLAHPIIDADGHIIEFLPGVYDTVRSLAGARLAEQLEATINARRLEGPRAWYQQTPEERRDTRSARFTFWAFPTKNTIDRATSMLPGLLYERARELGFDYSVLYPSMGAVFQHQIADEALRRAACRAWNTYYAEACAPYADRITPVALIPLHTPQEGVEELHYAVNELKLKVALIPSFVQRPIPAVARRYPEAPVRWFDTFGLDSEYDYDPFWKACEELGVPVSAHSPGFGYGWPMRNSPSNFVYNHIGNFADPGEAICKSLFLGGVTRRFPKLRFAFLEGGVSWGARVYADLIGHWEKRNAGALAYVDPANLNGSQLIEYARKYPLKGMQAYQDAELLELMALDNAERTRAHRREIDEFAACGVTSKEDIRRQFIPSFFFGCEADDPTLPVAFSKANPGRARLSAILGSDIGHWDVPDMTHVAGEAYELLEEGEIAERDLKDFVYLNAARMFSESNPAFFQGTVLEKQVEKDLRIMG